MFDQRGELPLLPFGNPIGFVPASRGGVYIESDVFIHAIITFFGRYFESFNGLSLKIHPPVAILSLIGM